MADVSGSPQALLFDSTRGQDQGRSLGQAIARGLAADGGLFLPREIPCMDVQALPHDSFLSLSKAVLRPWVAGGEFALDIDGLLDDALSFPVPLVPLGHDTFICELFHGPTLSFKDFGARTMARMLGNRLRRTGERCVILVATSGDTGSAVADGFAGLEGIDVVLLYPDGGVSEVQERQLIVDRPGVHPFAVRGAFDDCQRLVKEAFRASSWADIPLSTANSINIGRLLPQMFYYWWSVLNVTRGLGLAAPTVCVPSGNLGNLTAGVLAHLSGMPVGGFVAAHNANDFFARFLQDARAEMGQTIPTVSNAMDVGAPSNFERLKALLSPSKMHSLIQAASVSDEATLAAMGRIHRETSYLADPHTAVGLEVVAGMRKTGSLDGPVVVMSTAHPAKFPDTCFQATGAHPQEPDQLQRLRSMPSNKVLIDADVEILEQQVRNRLGG